MIEKTTQNAEKTIELGKKIGKQLGGGEVLALTGELGSGKTTFIKGLAEGLGVDELITSPTYILMNQYRVSDKDIKLCHFDFYRLEDDLKAPPADLTDFLKKDDCICAIEWAGKVKKWLPGRTIFVNFKHLDSKRKIEIKKEDNLNFKL